MKDMPGEGEGVDEDRAQDAGEEQKEIGEFNFQTQIYVSKYLTMWEKAKKFKLRIDIKKLSPAKRIKQGAIRDTYSIFREK